MRPRRAFGCGFAREHRLAAFILAWLAAGACAAAMQIRFPCVGEINTERTNLRAGPSLNYEIMAKLEKGARVTVSGMANGWLRVVPSKNIPFWVAARYISGGRVTCGRLNVRARPLVNSVTVCQLSRNDAVEEIERRGEWMSIRPPRGAVLWVSSELVDLMPEEKEEEKAPAAGGVEAAPPAAQESPDATRAAGARAEEKEQPGATAEAAVAPSGKPAAYEGKLIRSEGLTISGTPFSLVRGFWRRRVVCMLCSKTINLNYYEGDRVKVWGYELSRTATGIPLIDVRRLELQ